MLLVTTLSRAPQVEGAPKAGSKAVAYTVPHGVLSLVRRDLHESATIQAVNDGMEFD
jgi:hypothetical protein